MLRQNHVRMALFVCLGLIAVAVYGFAAEEKEKPGKAAPNAKGRRDAAKKVYDGAMQRYMQDPESVPGDVGYFHEWSVRWMQAEHDLGRTKTEEVAALEGHLKRMETWKAILDERVKQAVAPVYSASAAEFFRLEAEDWLFEARYGK